MNLVEIKNFLTKKGLKGLSLVKSDDATKTHTFTFTEFHDQLMGVSPTIAAGGKVAIYTFPDVGKVGVSPSNKFVRFVDDGKRDKAPRAADAHLGFVKVTPELTILFQKASIDPGQRLKYMAKLWSYLNEEKFGKQMPEPKFKSDNKSPMSRYKTARGVYSPGRAFGAGQIWMAGFMFNAREPFFLEVFLHEMCHQAVWCISKSTSREEEGHGKLWKTWMRHVGLDPRRYDPTDDVEYKDPSQTIEEEEENTTQFGPRADGKYINSLRKMEEPVVGEAVYVWKGRAIPGYLRQNEVGTGWTFTFRRPDGELRQFYWKSDAQFRSGGLMNLRYKP